MADYNVNYAVSYSQALANAYPKMLQFGKLWNTENARKYKVVDAKTIKIPVMDVAGRSDGDRDTINLAGAKRRHSNDWETKTLGRQRYWDTLIHPMDVQESNMIATIANATATLNEQEKPIELDCELISDILKDYKLAGGVEDNTVLTQANVLSVIDAKMAAMDEAFVPKTGRILYVDTFTKTLIDNAKEYTRVNGDGSLQKAVSRIGELEVIGVTTSVLKTAYDFTDGCVPAVDARQIHMFFVHPSAVLPVVNYSFAGMSEPSANTQGKAYYYEESFEDFFVLNRKKGAIAFVVEAPTEG